MTVNRPTVSALLVPGLRKVMFMEYEQAAIGVYKEIFNVESSKRAYEEWVGLAGVGPAEEKPEGQAIIYKDIAQLNAKRVSMVTYALGMRCTMEAKQDEQYGQLRRLAEALGRAFKVREEVEAMNILNCGFATVLATGYDGLALFSASHTIRGSAYAPATTNITAIPSRTTQTASNLLAAADLDYTSLTDMLTLFMRQVDETGDFVSITPRNLIVAPENWWVAQEILKSNMRPDTPNNAVSTVFNLNLRPIMSQYLIDQDAWFMSADKGSHDLMFFDRMPFTVSSEDHFDTADSLMKGLRRFGVGFADWRGICGTQGA